METLDYLMTLEPDQVREAVEALPLEEKKKLAGAMCRKVQETEDMLMEIIKEGVDTTH